MIYNKTLWQDHITELPNRYKEMVNLDGTVTLTPERGEVIQQGTPLDAVHLNKMEDGIEAAHLELAGHNSDGQQHTKWILAIEEPTDMKPGDHWLRIVGAGINAGDAYNGGDQSYTYIQSVPSTTWVVPLPEGFKKFPSVTVVDSAHSVVYGVIQYDESTNTVTLTFTDAFSGEAHFN